MNTGVVISTYGMIIREEPLSSSKVVGTLEPFDSVNVLYLSDNWYRIEVNGVEGFVPKNSIVLERVNKHDNI